jgi:hypothetical protein
MILAITNHNDSKQRDIQHDDTQHNNTRHKDSHNATQHNDTQHNDTQHNDTQRKDIIIMLSDVRISVASSQNGLAYLSKNSKKKLYLTDP